MSVLGGERWWTVLRPPAIYGPRDTDVLQFFKMAKSGFMAIPAGERWVTVAHVADVVRAILAAASGRGAHRVLHLGEPSPRRLDELLETLAASGGVRARVVRVPAAVLTVGGAAGSLLQRLGLRRVALTADKARELNARHWTASTAASLAELGLGAGIRFEEGAAATWAWYRAAGMVVTRPSPRRAIPNASPSATPPSPVIPNASPPTFPVIPSSEATRDLLRSGKIPPLAPLAFGMTGEGRELRSRSG